MRASHGLITRATSGADAVPMNGDLASYRERLLPFAGHRAP